MCNYTAFGAQSVIVSERLCEALELRAGQRVLDIGTGHGNSAIAAARRHCEVTGLDINAEMLELAAKRAAVEHLAVTFEEGDAEHLPYDDASFDVVISTFGVIDVYNPRAVDEALRVLKPGGQIGLANWAPHGAYLVEDALMGGGDVPDDLDAPLETWMKPGRHRNMFGSRVRSLRIAYQIMYYYHTSVEGYADILLPLLGVAADQTEKARAFMIANFERMNVSEDATLKLPYHYLEVVATRQ